MCSIIQPSVTLLCKKMSKAAIGDQCEETVIDTYEHGGFDRLVYSNIIRFSI